MILKISAPKKNINLFIDDDNKLIAKTNKFIDDSVVIYQLPPGQWTIHSKNNKYIYLIKFENESSDSLNEKYIITIKIKEYIENNILEISGVIFGVINIYWFFMEY